VIEENSEENTARLIRAAYDPSARPTVEASEGTFHLLLEHVRAPVAVEDFPDLVVGFLGGMLAIAVAWLIVRVAWGGASFSADLALFTVGVWAIVNLSVVPVAGIVILKRRKHG
jgi:hypothetical protein